MIESTKNNQVKTLTGLLKKSKTRKEEGVYVVEGRRMFEEAPENLVVKAYLSESFYERYKDADKVATKLSKVEYEILRDDVYEYASDTKTPQGVMCIMKQENHSPVQILSKENPLIIFLENLQDPGNLGTIIRTAEGAGFTGVIMSENTVDIYNPKTIRSTMGSIFRVPFCYVEDIQSTIHDAKSRGIKVYAAHLGGQKSYDKIDCTKSTAYVIGNEGNGLTEETAKQCDELVIIPMQGQVESLNAATAATVLMFEAARQRR